MSHTPSDDSRKRKWVEDSSTNLQSSLQSEPCSEERKKKKHKHDKSSMKKKHKKKKSSSETKKDKKLHKRNTSSNPEEIVGPKITVAPSKPTAQRSLGPMTKEQYEKKQSTIRRVFDEDTGRHRLVRGDGEVIEEIVSKQRQQEINKAATTGDGLSFQSGLMQFCK